MNSEDVNSFYTWQIYGIGYWKQIKKCACKSRVTITIWKNTYIKEEVEEAIKYLKTI